MPSSQTAPQFCTPSTLAKMVLPHLLRDLLRKGRIGLKSFGVKIQLLSSVTSAHPPNVGGCEQFGGYSDMSWGREESHFVYNPALVNLNDNKIYPGHLLLCSSV